jgi:hypothetical protein
MLFAFTIHTIRIGISKHGHNLGLVGCWIMDDSDTPWTSANTATTIDKYGVNPHVAIPNSAGLPHSNIWSWL